MPLTDPTSQQHLQRIARQLATQCPDLRQMAREVAAAALQQFGHSSLDPDAVYLHRFKGALSNPRTFSGWEHREVPYQSLTLVQLVMRRFDVQDQDDADLLSYRTGFYRQGAHAGVFDEHNEIPMAPVDLLRHFWAVDFCSTVRDRVRSFWAGNAEAFRTMAKVTFLARLDEARHAEPRPERRKRYRTLGIALTGVLDTPATLEQLQAQHSVDQGVRLCTFDIGGYVASDIFRVVMPDGYQLLYVPGEVDAVQLFASHDELYWWVLQNTNAAQNRARFMAHFALSSQEQSAKHVGLNQVIDVLFYHWGGRTPLGINQREVTLAMDAFTYLRDSARQRMEDDVHFALRSNADLRKQMWIADLQVVGKLSGAMAAFDWPVALAAVGAGLAETGLSIDQAINGHTTAERQAGVIGAVLATIDTALNAATLGEAEPETDLIDPPVPKPSTEAEAEAEAVDMEIATDAALHTYVPAPHQPAARAQLLSPFETNVVLDGEPLAGGALQGIYAMPEGQFVEIDGLPYQVRYVGELRSWVVIDPATPYSFYRNVPIRRDVAGRWEPAPQTRLQGGMPMARLNLWGRPSTPKVLPEPTVTPYDLPARMRARLVSISDDHLSGIIYSASNARLERACDEFRIKRNLLLADAERFFPAVELPPRPQIPLFDNHPSAKQIIKGSYQRSEGLVVGECHSHLGSKRFLIDNMAQLKKQNVGVLYLEHLLSDFHQADLDTFYRTARMPQALHDYVEELDRAQATDPAGHYTFMQVMLAAQANGLRIHAIDCMASYRQAWLSPPSETARQQMMNFFAHRVIDTDQAVRGPSKWLALVGNTHANTFDGVPGLAELEGAIGLRVEDILVGQAERFGIDAGIQANPAAKLAEVKCDLLLQVPITPIAVASQALEAKLAAVGSFCFTEVDKQLNLVHRSKKGELTFTPIRKDGAYYYIDRASWPRVDKRRMSSLSQLATLIASNGLRYVTT